MSSGFLAGLAFQTTQNQDRSVLVGQAAQLFVQQKLEVGPSSLVRDGWFRHVGHLPFPTLSSGGGCSRFQRGLVGHAIKPVSNHLPWHDGPCLAHKNQKGGLEGILGVLFVSEEPAAQTPHHRPMTVHQGGQGGRIPKAEVVLQQLSIGQTRPIPQQNQPAQVLEDLAHCAGRHRSSLTMPFPLWGLPTASLFTITGTRPV